MAKELVEGPEAVAAILPLTATARERLTRYVALLTAWQVAKNLVAPSTLPVVWSRHVADSAQALAAVPEAKRWLDIGSGAGFPGLVTAILLAETADAKVTLVEANGRKVAFLRTVIRELGLPATVLAERIEQLAGPAGAGIGPVDAVSARALAPLGALYGYAAPWLTTGSVGVFHKGQDFASEVNETSHAWTADLVEHRSRIDPGGRIVVVRDLRPR